MHRQLSDLETASLRQKESFDTLKDKTGGPAQPAGLDTGHPADHRMDIVGIRPAHVPLFTGRKEFHKGLDIANHKGTAIVATADGVVTFVGRKNNMGKVIVIDHGHGMITRYAHFVGHFEAARREGHAWGHHCPDGQHRSQYRPPPAL